MTRYTDEPMERARNIDLEQFLRSRGERLVRAGHEWRWIYRDSGGEHDSVTVRGGEWYDHKRETGGDAIGFLQEFMDMEFKEAVAELLNEEPIDQSPSQCSASPGITDGKIALPLGEFILPERAVNMRRLYAYLTKTRLLSPGVVTHFVHAGSLYEDAKHHNAVFLGLDETGAARAATLKGTLTGSKFRQTLAGSDTRYGFQHKGTSELLYVFEAPIDMLSFISMNQNDWQRHSYLALDGLSAKAMRHFLSLNPYIIEICLCLDNDAAGIEAAGRFRDELVAGGYTSVTRLAPEQKDWNGATRIAV